MIDHRRFARLDGRLLGSERLIVGGVLGIYIIAESWSPADELFHRGPGPL